MTVKGTVLGASGFTGGELLRLFSSHPELELLAASGERRAGESVAGAHPQLAGAFESLCSLDEALSAGGDVCFSCLPSGHLRGALDRLRSDLVVDLSDDFRASGGNGEWVYGLAEFSRALVTSARRIANPGCYPTAALLCLVPFARTAAITGPIVIDAMSGASGAGRKTEDRLLFSSLSASVTAYGTTEHRHVPEIERGLAAFGGLDVSVSFTPHLVPMARGLLVTARAPLVRALDDAEALRVLYDAYSGEPFVDVLEDWPATKPVSGTNRAHVSARVDRRNDLLVCSAAIDNLGKGAAGQAVQNANLALGLEESSGLTSYGVWP